MESLKTCSICKKDKALSEFHKKKRNKDGLCPDCKNCAKIRMSNYYLANIETLKTRKVSSELIKQRTNKYKATNKEKVKLMNKAWKIKNNKLCRSYGAKRRAKKLNATIGNYDTEIKEIYLTCPEGFHVDHIIPLQGETVSGLHVPWNLQHLSAKENLSKSNKV